VKKGDILRNRDGMRGLGLEKGFGAPYGLALGLTDKVRPINTRDRKNTTYILPNNKNF